MKSKSEISFILIELFHRGCHNLLMSKFNNLSVDNLAFNIHQYLFIVSKSYQLSLNDR